jgi:hypothetical protein
VDAPARLLDTVRQRGLDAPYHLTEALMRRHHYALFFLVLLIVIIIVGWNRGWFTVNRQNIEQDKEKAVEKIKEGLDKLKPSSQKDATK